MYNEQWTMAVTLRLLRIVGAVAKLTQQLLTVRCKKEWANLYRKHFSRRDSPLSRAPARDISPQRGEQGLPLR